MLLEMRVAVTLGGGMVTSGALEVLATFCFLV